MKTIAEIYAELKQADNGISNFEKDPAAALKALLPDELSDEQIEKLADGVQKLLLKDKMEAMIAGAGLFPRA